MATIYNVTGTSDPNVKATKFLDAIPAEELLAVKNDPGIGHIFYDRLISLEASGGTLDASVPYTIAAVDYALGKAFITDKTKAALVGTTADLTERNYDISTVSGDVAKWVQANRIPADAPYTIKG